MNLQQITLEDYDRFLPFFKNQTYPLCAYSLPSIIAWTAECYYPVAAILEESLIVAAENANDVKQRHLLLPISPEKDWTPAALHKLAKDAGFDCFRFVPEEWIEKKGIANLEEFFSIKEQPGLSDYVYKREDLAELAGRKYSKKRNLISQFEKAYGPERIDVDFIRQEDIQGCLNCLEKWCTERDCDQDPETSMACEKKAASRALHLMDDTDFRGLRLKLDSEIVAFGIANRLTNGMGVLHFEKAVNEYKGLYQYFDRECARKLFPEDILFINKESDMDEPGLAQAKESYHPAFRVKSFELTRK